MNGSWYSLEKRELNGIDGEPVEFSWDSFPGHTILELLREIQKTMAENRSQPEQFRDRIIFMSMYNEPIGRKMEMNECVFCQGHRSFLDRRKMVWNAHLRARRFVELLCRKADASSPRMWTSCLSSNKVRWTEDLWKSKKRGKLSIHHNGDRRVVVFAPSFPSTSSESTERYRIGVQDWLSRSQIIRFPVRRDPWRIWMKSQIIDSHPMSWWS